jgi:porin
MRRISIILIFLLFILQAGVALSQPLYEDQVEDSANDPLALQGIRERSGYSDVPEFGGPGSVGAILREDNETNEGLIRLKLLDRAFKPWFDFKGRVNKRIGLAFGLDYTAIYQVGTESLGEDDAAGGIFRFFGSWTLFGRDSGNTGTFTYKVESRHRLGTEIAPQSLGSELGYVGLTAQPFNDAGWMLTNFYWQQRLFGGRLSIIVGMVDTTDYVDIYALVNPWTQFNNLSFGISPTIPTPNPGLGAAFGAMATDHIYIIAGIADTNGDPTDPFNNFDTFFDDHEYFTHAEIGWVSSYEKRYMDNIHLTFWHADEREKLAVPGGWGMAFSSSWYFYDSLLPFFRAGYSDTEASLLEGNISAGLGYYRQGSSDLLGVGIGWGKPHDDSLRDQYTAELFYRFQIAENLAVTPDIQFLIDPANNPDHDFITVFGIRARLAL